ncbi:MAG: hypothetical protein ACLRMJ_02470 [Alistipes finegoldii]
MKDLDELFRRVTGMDVRVASAETGIAEESKRRPPIRLTPRRSAFC